MCHDHPFSQRNKTAEKAVGGGGWGWHGSGGKGWGGQNLKKCEG